MLGVIEGSNSEKERIRSAKETSQRPVAGTDPKQIVVTDLLLFICIFIIIIMQSGKGFTHHHRYEREKHGK